MPRNNDTSWKWQVQERDARRRERPIRARLYTQSSVDAACHACSNRSSVELGRDDRACGYNAKSELRVRDSIDIRRNAGVKRNRRRLAVDGGIEHVQVGLVDVHWERSAVRQVERVAILTRCELCKSRSVIIPSSRSKMHTLDAAGNVRAL